MEEKKNLANKVVDKMYNNDLFSQWLGIERIEVAQGRSILKMKVRKEMLNGFNIAHGGIAFSLADSALAFASNAYGRLSVALECSISYPVAVKEGDILTCEAKELSLTNKTGTYLIEVKNQKNEKVAFFKGIVYRTSKEWFPECSTDNESKQIYRNDDVNHTTVQKKEKLIYPEVSYKIIGCAFEVFNKIGGGHKEVVYQRAMKNIFENQKLKVKENVYYPVKLGEKTIGKNYLDFLVDKKVIVELKSLSRFSKAHFDQVLNYLKVSKLKLAILLNFTSSQVKIKRVVNFEQLNEINM